MSNHVVSISAGAKGSNCGMSFVRYGRRCHIAKVASKMKYSTSDAVVGLRLR